MLLRGCEVMMRKMEMGVAHPFGSLRKLSYFCITTEGKPKMHNPFEASVAEVYISYNVYLRPTFRYGAWVGDSLIGLLCSIVSPHGVHYTFNLLGVRLLDTA
jgi:hypothetical protein